MVLRLVDSFRLTSIFTPIYIVFPLIRATFLELIFNYSRMGKKKPFIDKKTASTFHVVRRSQRDVGGYFDENGVPLDMPQEFILMPSSPGTQQRLQSTRPSLPSSTNSTSNTSSWDKAKMQLKQAGLMDDYDYDQHTRPITGSGVFISSDSGKAIPLSQETLPSTLVIENSIQELDRQLESIALNSTCIDDDIAHALFDDYDEGEFEELTDDFCILASQEPLEGDGIEETHSVQEFDFDAHIARLLEKARREEGPINGPHNHTWWEHNQNEFRGVKARRPDAILEDEYEDDVYEEDMDDDNGMEETNSMFWSTVHGRTDEEEKALCEKFQQTLAEYDDSDDESESSVLENNVATSGLYQVEGDARFEALLDDYLSEKRDEIFMEGTNKSILERKRCGGGSSFMVLSGRQMVREEDMNQEGPTGTLDDMLAEADLLLSNPVNDLPPEEVLIDGKSYFAERYQNPWDCESILSTYSNLDNNPSIIGRSKRSSTKKKQVELIEKDRGRCDGQPIQVILSRKTGLPLLQTSVVSLSILEETSVISVNLGAARRKEESKDEKRLRKIAVKEQKQISKVQKKMMRTMFQTELSKRCENTVKDDIGGVSVYRYT